jgi:hypothetical protein
MISFSIELKYLLGDITIFICKADKIGNSHIVSLVLCLGGLLVIFFIILL